MNAPTYETQIIQDLFGVALPHIELTDEKGFAKALKFNECHNPAGSPEGGEFCSGDGGGASADGPVSNIGLHRTESEAVARARFRQALLKRYPTSMPVLGDTIFATIGEPSGFVSGDKVMVKINVPRQYYKDVVPDMRYLPAGEGGNPYTQLLTEHPKLVGADIGMNWNSSRNSWIESIKRVDGKKSTRSLVNGNKYTKTRAFTDDYLHTVVKALDFADEESSALEKLAARLEPALRRRFLAAVAQIRNNVNLERLAEAIEANSVTAAQAAAKIAEFPERYGVLAADLRAGFLVGAGFAIRQLAASRIPSSFTLINPQAVAYARTHLPAIMQPFTQEAKDLISDMVTRAVGGQFTPMEVARRIRDQIGLDPRRVTALDTYRQSLIDQGMGGDLLERKVARYAQALIRQRSETIARTEVMRAANAGQRQTWQDAARKGLLNPAEWQRVWHVTGDDRLCPECLIYDDPRAGTVAFNGEFAEGDPPLHPNCRCTVDLQLIQGAD